MNELSRAINRAVNYFKAFMFRVKVSLFEFLAKYGFVKKHSHSEVNTDHLTQPIPLPDLAGKRYVFGMSYVLYQTKYVSECWYETESGKRLFTISDHHDTKYFMDYRADLKSFCIQYTPFRDDGRWCSPTDCPSMKSVFHELRHRFTFQIEEPPTDPKNPSPKVLFKSYERFKDMIAKELPEINEKLSGVKNDGWLVDKDNHPLCENIVCKGCFCPVFSTDSRNPYIYNCINHGIIDHTLVNRVSHNVFEKSLRCSFNYLKKYCE